MANQPPLSEGCTYHIYNRGTNGETLFRTQRNYLFFLQRYAATIQPVAETYAYCLMGNHFHLAIRTRMPEEQADYHAAHADRDALPASVAEPSVLPPLQRLRQSLQPRGRPNRQPVRAPVPPQARDRRGVLLAVDHLHPPQPGAPRLRRRLPRVALFLLQRPPERQADAAESRGSPGGSRGDATPSSERTTTSTIRTSASCCWSEAEDALGFRKTPKVSSRARDLPTFGVFWNPKGLPEHASSR
jgi:hypothetical protein